MRNDDVLSQKSKSSDIVHQVLDQMNQHNDDRVVIIENNMPLLLTYQNVSRAKKIINHKDRVIGN